MNLVVIHKDIIHNRLTLYGGRDSFIGAVATDVSDFSDEEDCYEEEDTESELPLTSPCVVLPKPLKDADVFFDASDGFYFGAINVRSENSRCFKGLSEKVQKHFDKNSLFFLPINDDGVGYLFKDNDSVPSLVVNSYNSGSSKRKMQGLSIYLGYRGAEERRLDEHERLIVNSESGKKGTDKGFSSFSEWVGLLEKVASVYISEIYSSFSEKHSFIYKDKFLTLDVIF